MFFYCGMPFKDRERRLAYQRAYWRANRRRFRGEPRVRPQTTCTGCGTPLRIRSRKYCSNRCQMDAQYREYIRRWLAGEVSGGSVSSVSDHVRRYLIECGGERCSRCGWAERHPLTGRVPLGIDHLNGHYADNRPSNVRLVCPNCHR